MKYWVIFNLCDSCENEFKSDKCGKKISLVPLAFYLCDFQECFWKLLDK